MQNAPPAAPLKPLLTLGLTVLALHLWLLQFAPRPHTTAPPLAGPLVVRTLPAETRPPPPPAPKAAKSRPRSVSPAPTDTASPENAPALTSAAPPAAPALDASAEAVTGALSPESIPAVEAAASEPTAAPASPPPAYAVPGSTRLKYAVTGTVRGQDYFASTELLWRHDGVRYDARLEVGAFLRGSRVQTSRGRIGEQGLEPKRFSDKARSEVAAHFERDKGKIIFSANTPEAPLQPGAQDQLSVLVQLASLFAGAPARYPAGSTLELQAVGAREASLWRFTVEGPEQLQLPGGELATLKLTRPPTHPYDLQAELWLAPALGYLPARIRLSQHNGDFVDQQWRSTDVP